MKTLSLSLLLLLSACGAAPTLDTASAERTQAFVSNEHVYKYVITGAGVDYVATVYTDFGSANQVTDDILLHTIGGAPEERYYDGENTVANFVTRSPGNFTVQLYKDDVLVQAKSTSAQDETLSFNQDIE